MLGQYPTGFGNRMDQCGGELPGLKMGYQLATQCLPEFRTALLVNRHIAKDGKRLRLGCHEDQNRIALLGLGHTKALEMPLRRFHRFGYLVVRDKDPNLTRGSLFGLPNSSQHAFFINLGQKVSVMHDHFP